MADIATPGSQMSSDASLPSTVQQTFRNRQDLILLPLVKVLSPLETELWIDKFSYWYNMAWGEAGDPVKASEVKVRLDPEWVSHFKGVINWTTASFADVCEAIRAELLIQDSMLTRQDTLFDLSVDKGETLLDFIT